MSILEPISEKYPYGIDYRYDDEYLETEVEIEKSFNVTSESETRWDYVASRCEKILQENTKDLKIASYWLYSQWKLKSGREFLDSFKTYARFIENYQKNLYPKAGRRKVKIVEWTERVFEEPLLKSVEAFSEDMLEDLLETLERLQKVLPATLETEQTFFKEIGQKSRGILEAARRRREEEKRREELLKEEERRRIESEKALSEAEKLRRKEEEKILSKFAPSSAAAATPAASDPAQNCPSLSEEDRAEALGNIKEICKKLFEESPVEFLPFRLLFGPAETLLESAISGTDIDDLIPSEDICSAARQLLEPGATGIDQLKALEEQILLRPAWLEGYYIASTVLYRLERADEASKIESMLLYFMHRNKEIFDFRTEGRALVEGKMLSWAKTKLLSICDEGKSSAEYKRVYQEVLAVMKEQSRQNAFELLEEHYKKASGEEERFRWMLLFVEFALEIGDKQLALSLLLELERLIEEYKVDRWQPELAITVYETLLKPIMAHELGNERKERIYNKLSILSIQKVIKI